MSTKKHETREEYTTHLRTFCYIDGFNLYYGLKAAGLRQYFWLNIRALAAPLLRPPFVLSGTKYFTARIAGKHPNDSEEKAAEREASRVRQTTFIEALDTLPALDIIEGQFLLKREFCRKCSADFHRPEEKMTDAAIATEIVADAFLDRFDAAIVVSADSDLLPAIQCIRQHFPHRKMTVAFPPKRFSNELRYAASACIHINETMLRNSQLAEEITKPNGVILRRPPEWV